VPLLRASAVAKARCPRPRWHHPLPSAAGPAAVTPRGSAASPELGRSGGNALPTDAGFSSSIPQRKRRVRPERVAVAAPFTCQNDASALGVNGLTLSVSGGFDSERSLPLLRKKGEQGFQIPVVAAAPAGRKPTSGPGLLPGFPAGARQGLVNAMQGRVGGRLPGSGMGQCQAGTAWCQASLEQDGSMPGRDSSVPGFPGAGRVDARQGQLGARLLWSGMGQCLACPERDEHGAHACFSGAALTRDAELLAVALDECGSASTSVRHHLKEFLTSEIVL